MSHLSSLQLVLLNIVCNIHICVWCAWITSIPLSLCFCFSLSGKLLVINGHCRRRRWFASGRWTPRDQPCLLSTYLKNNVPILPLCPWLALLGDLTLYPWPLQPLTFHQREEERDQTVTWWSKDGSLMDLPALYCQVHWLVASFFLSAASQDLGVLTTWVLGPGARARNHQG